MKEKYLPIGSVVLLTNGTKNVMITGYLPIDTEDDNKMYDYTGCLFPEGVIIDSETLAFNHDQIQQIVYEGLNNEESAAFINTIKNIANMNNQPTVTDQVESQPVNNSTQPVEATETLSEEPVPSAPISQVTPESVPTQPAIAQPIPISNIPNMIQIQPMQAENPAPAPQPMQPQEEIVPFGGN